MSPKMIVLSALLVLGIQVSYVNSHLKGYVGCFWDNLKVRALHHHGGYFASVAECRAQCRAANWRYTAMQAQLTCYCGTTYDYYGPADGCDTKCSVGEGSCGKILMNAVYLTYPEKVHHQPRGYWGCFLDRKVHALKHWAGHVSSIPECVGLCRMVYYQPFAGLQNGRDCWCGKNYNKYGKANDCKLKCPIGLECGGTNSNTVYRVHGVPLNPKPPKGYMGCFRDDARRALPIRVFDVKNVRQCIQECYDRNQPYAGLQMGKGCYCGKNYARWGKQTNCNKKCKSGEICGGWSSNSVYKTYAALNPNPPGGHLGCYRDDAKRSLPIMVGHVDSIGECIERCRVRKQPYAGLQMGKGCYCGKNYAKYGKQTNCTDRCKTGEICGGFSSNSVYKV